MLLAFCWLAARPTHVVKTDCALNVSASAFDFADPDLASWIGTKFCALLDVKFRKHGLILDVVFSDFICLRSELLHKVNSVGKTSFKRMNVLLAIKAKMKVTMLASSCVVLAVNVCN